MRIKTLVAALPLVVLLGACGTGGAEFKPTDKERPTATGSVAAPATPAVPKTAEAGTRGNPYPIGTQVTSGEWEVTLGAPSNGTAAILAENQFNTPPADGQEFWLVPVSVTYVGDEAADPFWDLTVEFVGDDGLTYDGMECGVIPNDLVSVGEMYPGAKAAGNVCVGVPAGAPGLFSLSTLLGDKIFFDHNTGA